MRAKIWVLTAIIVGLIRCRVLTLGQGFRFALWLDERERGS